MNTIEIDRVLFCGHESGISGAQKCLLMLLDELGKSFEKTPVIALPARGEASRWLETSGFDVSTAPVVSWVGMGPNSREKQVTRFFPGLGDRLEQWVRLIREKNIALVVSNTSVLLEPALAAAICGIPHVWHILEVMDRDPDLEPVVDRGEYCSVLSALSDQVVVVSEVVAGSLRSKIPDVNIIHTGIGISNPKDSPDSVRDSLRIPKDHFVVIYAGILSRRKGVTDLAKAVVRILREKERTSIVIVGKDGGVEHEVRKILREFRNDSRLYLLGHRNDVLDLMRASNVLIMPSLVDPLPVSVMEAMSCGLPVIATRSGGCEDLIIDGVTGKLVDVSSPDQIFDAVSYYHDHEAQAWTDGKRGNDRLRSHFTLQQNAKEFLKVLNEVWGKVVPDERSKFAAEFSLRRPKELGNRIFVSAVRLEDATRRFYRYLKGLGY